MTELEMIKAFAKLEGVELSMYSDEYYTPLSMKRTTKSNAFTKYNPITDHSLAFKAIVDYGVNVLSDEGCVYITNNEVSEYEVDSEVIVFVKDENTPAATIECILKSQGLWK